MTPTSPRSFLPTGLAAGIALVASLNAAAATPAVPHTLLDDVPLALCNDPTGKPLDANQRELLLARKVVAQLLDAPSGTASPGVALAIIDAPPAQILRTLRDYGHMHEFMPYVARATVDDHTANRWLVSYSIRGPLGIGNRDYQLETFDEKEVVDGLEILVSRFSYTGRGNIKDTRGTWRLIPVGGGTATFARYESTTDPGGAFTPWLKRRIASAGLPKIIQAIRKRVGAAGLP